MKVSDCLTMQSRTVVTAANFSHLNCLKNLLYSLRWERGVEVIVYDLGLGEDGVRDLRRVGYDVRRFDYGLYPEFLDINLDCGQYAWKPALISEVIAACKGEILWLDAGCLVLQNLEMVWTQIQKNGLVTPRSAGTIADWTHPGTLKFLKVSSGTETQKRNRNAAIVGFNAEIEWVRHFAVSWKEYSLNKACIAPEGSNRSNHRQDQSILSILYNRFKASHGFDDVNTLTEISQHNDNLTRTEVQGIIHRYNPVANSCSSLRRYSGNFSSKYGEDGVIGEVLRRFSIKAGSFCLSTRQQSSAVPYLCYTKGWKGVVVEHEGMSHGVFPTNEPNDASKMDDILCQEGFPEAFDVLFIEDGSDIFSGWHWQSRYKAKILIIDPRQVAVSGFHEGTDLKSKIEAIVTCARSYSYTLVCHVGSLIFLSNEFLMKAHIPPNELRFPEKLFTWKWITESGKTSVLEHLFVFPRGGLANRLRVIASARRICAIADARFSLFWSWPPFAGLFYNDDVEIRTEPLSSSEHAKFVELQTERKGHELGLEIQLLPCLQYRRIILNTCHAFADEKDSSSLSLRELVKWLPSPSESVSKSVSAFTDAFFPRTGGVVGFHIRRTDNIEAAILSPDSVFFAAAERCILDGKHIFLATDNRKTEQAMLERFGKYVIIFPKDPQIEERWPRKYVTASEIIAAYIDLRLLACCDSLFTSKASSFSALAEAMQIEGNP